jgi:hypothetical protein
LVKEPVPVKASATLTVQTPVPVKTKRTKKKRRNRSKLPPLIRLAYSRLSKPRSWKIHSKKPVRDFKRFASASGAEKFEDALPGFKDEKDLQGFIGWVLRGTPGYKK